MKSQYLLAITFLVISFGANAEVTLDGTLGSSGALPGPDYLIESDLGQQRGGNLFHSFQEFNLNRLESATFSGPNSLNNIISRVTGGNPSNIDGLIRSTVPADMYFLNPNGIMFGPNAQLDVQGSFHASTADYLRLKDGGRFDARNPSDSLLTVAPIESFGFLDNPHGKIEVNGRAGLDLESDTPRALLQVPVGESLSLIGGDIYLSQSLDELPLETIGEGTPEEVQREIQAAQYREQRFSQLYAPSGYINLASIQKAGEVALTKNGLNSTAIQGGLIQLEQEAYISTTGESGGNVFIRAGEFTMDNSTIYARTLGTQDGGVVDIQADNITLDNYSKIRGGTDGLGDGTDIRLSATETYYNELSALNTYAGDHTNRDQRIGDAGHINIQAKDIHIESDWGFAGNFASNTYGINHGFASNTYGTGQGGNIQLRAENNLNMRGTIQANTFGTNELAGDAGDFSVFADSLYMEAARIRARSFGSGDAGRINIQTRYLYMTRHKTTNSTANINNSIMGSGNGNLLTIYADDILMEGGSYITSSTISSGNAGDIDIQVGNQFILRGTTSNGWSTGIWSSSEIAEKNKRSATTGHIHIGGHAGNIHISAGELRLEEGAQIAASSEARYHSASTGQAGNITLEIKEALIVSGVNPYGENSDGFGSMVASHTQGNAGDAGNIHIKAGSVSLLKGGFLETGTDNFSRGGNIQIKVDKQIILSDDASQISLQEPNKAQVGYLTSQDFNTETYNQSTSGIYAHSTNQTMNSGDSGNIEVSAPLLILSNKGQISTACKGGGQAGQIVLNVEKLILNDNALIRSNSDLINQLTFDSIATRDNHLIKRGTVVKTKDGGNGKATYQISLGKVLLNFKPFIQVADMVAFDNLLGQVAVGDGLIVIVENAENGQSARLIYEDFFTGTNEPWTRINEDKPVTLDNFDPISYPSIILEEKEQLPYENGTQIHVKDMGNGKAADFIYATRLINDLWWGRPIRVEYYQVADIASLQNLVAKMDLLVGAQAYVSKTKNGNPARFLFDGNDWIRFGQELEVPDVKAQQNLLIAEPGHIAYLPTGSTIYTGSEWIDMGHTYRVNTLAERDQLPVQNGDLVKVADTGNGRHDAFLYANAQWIRQIRGGDAGQIVINADTIQISNGSEISTGSISGGGGSVTLNVDKLVYLTDSQVTTSVQEGVGNGGDLTIKGPQFVIMNNGKIIAQAYEGRGGNIHLGGKQLIKSPCSQISASSKLGIDGNVQIDSPTVDMDAFMVILPGGYVEAQLKQCTREEIENPSTFKIDLTRKGTVPFGKGLKLNE